MGFCSAPGLVAPFPGLAAPNVGLSAPFAGLEAPGRLAAAFWLGLVAPTATGLPAPISGKSL